jgi:hypothetical protein
VIVGSGLAGYSLVRELRKHNADTPILLVTADDGTSYSKPMLSTGFGKGKDADGLAQAGSESMADASTWADRMRDDPSRFWQQEAGPYHYVDVPPGKRYDEVRPSRKGNALIALSQFREELLDPNTSHARRQLAVKFAIHIIQDLHQPLHVGNGRDRGGNDVKITVEGKRSNFHRLWDSQILYSAGRSDRQWLRYFESSGLLRKPVTADANPMLWVEESAALRDRLYPAPSEVGERYFRTWLPQAELRLALSGIRTAAWLNATLGGPQNAAGQNNRNDDPKTWWKRLFSN